MVTKLVKNTKMLLALRGENLGRPPVWLMRQAGRYMPEYRSIRARYSFLEMCHNPELITEITMLPIRAFGMDAAILFSDILLVAEALGVGLTFQDGKGPVIGKPLSRAKDVDQLPIIDVEEKLSFVALGIKQLLIELNIPLLGFCGAPFTVASYMIEGSSSHDLIKTKQWMLNDPESFHKLLSKIAEVTKRYVLMQVEAGVDAIQIFDSWANCLSWDQFTEFSFKYMKELVDELKIRRVPSILYCRGSSVFAPKLVDAAPSAISLDWNCDLSTIRKMIPFQIALQGNLDPDVLYAPNYKIEQEVARLINSMHGDPGFIFNLGHGIKPDTPYDAVRTLVETVKSF